VRNTRGGQTSQHYVPLRQFATMSVRADDDVIFFKDTVKPTLTVTVEGAVLGQSVFTADRGARLSQVLNFIRTDPQLADIEAIHLKRKTVAETQKRILDENLRRLEEALFKTEKLSRGEIEIRVREADLLRRVIDTLQRVRPSGIVVLRRNGAIQDITLENEDIIVVPSRNDTVEIGGEVVAPQSFRWEPQLTPRDYLARSGGITDLGRRDKFIIYHRNGEITTGEPAVVRPGDQVLFLPYIRTNHLQVALDITEVITRTLLLSRAATFF
jgi:hypothetical protein